MLLRTLQQLLGCRARPHFCLLRYRLTSTAASISSSGSTTLSALEALPDLAAAAPAFLLEGAESPPCEQQQRHSRRQKKNGSAEAHYEQQHVSAKLLYDTRGRSSSRPNQYNKFVCRTRVLAYRQGVEACMPEQGRQQH